MTTKAEVLNANGQREVKCPADKCKTFWGWEDIHNGLIVMKCHICKNTFIKFNFTDDMPENMTTTEVRCKECGHLLYNSAMTAGTIRTKCHICGEWNDLKLDKVQESDLESIAKVG